MSELGDTPDRDEIANLLRDLDKYEAYRYEHGDWYGEAADRIIAAFAKSAARELVIPSPQPAADHYRRTAAALDATCRREEAERAVVAACRDVLRLYFHAVTTGSVDRDYLDAELSAALGQCDEVIAAYEVAPGSSPLSDAPKEHR